MGAGSPPAGGSPRPTQGGTGSVVCGTGAVENLTLPLESQVYLTGPIEPTRVCSTRVGGTPGVCGSGTCGGGPRNGMPCTPGDERAQWRRRSR